MQLYKKITAIIMAALILLIPFSSRVSAEELPGGYELPEYPDEIYGRDYILMLRNKVLYLYLVPQGSTVLISAQSDTYNDTGYELLSCVFPGGTITYQYAFGNPGWFCLETIGSGISVSHAPVTYIIYSTVDIVNKKDNTIIFFEKNADIMYEESIKFKFIKSPETTLDLIYNLLVMNSLALYGYIGYRCIKRTFARIRRIRNWKGERRC